MKALTKTGAKAEEVIAKAINNKDISLYMEGMTRLMTAEMALQLIFMAPKTTDAAKAAKHTAEIRRWLMQIRPTKDERERAIGPCNEYGNVVQKELRKFENITALTSEDQYPKLANDSIQAITAQWNQMRNAITGTAEEFKIKKQEEK